MYSVELIYGYKDKGSSVSIFTHLLWKYEMDGSIGRVALLFSNDADTQFPFWHVSRTLAIVRAETCVRWFDVASYIAHRMHNRCGLGGVCVQSTTSKPERECWRKRLRSRSAHQASYGLLLRLLSKHE